MAYTATDGSDVATSGVTVSEKSPENKERPNASEKKPVDRKLSEKATKALGGAAIKNSGKK